MASGSRDIDEPPEPIDRYIHLQRIDERECPKYMLTFTHWECRVKGLSKLTFAAVCRAIYLILAEIFRIVLSAASPEDKVRLRFSSKHLKSAIWTPLMPRSQYTVERIMLQVEQVLQSNESFRLDETFEIWTQIAKLPSGGCWTDSPKLLADKLRDKHSVVQVRNSDEICLARAIVIGKARADGDMALYKKLQTHRNPTHLGDKTAQTVEAKALIALAGLAPRRFDIADLKVFQKALPGYMIIAIGAEQLNSVIFRGEEREKKIMVLHHNNHFDVLTSIPVCDGASCILLCLF
jgi:hypothetical protein